jgi:anti-sigma B factor antagonist
MNAPCAKLLVFVSGQFACIKIVGRANFTSSLDFKTLVNELLQKEFNCFVLDLSECLLMDSTFLGVLAGFGLKMTASQNGRAIQLLNPNSRIAELLENLGVLHLFKIAKGPVELPNGAAAHTPALAPVQPSREEVTHNCLEAHNILMEIAPGNVLKFKEVARFLAEDLQKLRASS